MAIKVRDYEVRLTRTKEERADVRRLRYKIFVEEEGANASKEQQLLREEYDSYDRFADYMAVFHKGKIVGTYRIIDREAAEKMDGFYTETEFNLNKIKRVKGNIAEMSRACVDPEYRDSLVMRMLWMGLGDYILKNKIVLIFGVASWTGKQPGESAQAISYLYYNHLAPPSLRATVEVGKMDENVNPRFTKMNILPKDFVDENLARKQMTPLVKGYLRLGAKVGKGVFVDAPFNSYDVFMLMQTKNISKIYQKHFAGSPDAFDHLGIKPGAWKTFGKVLLSPVTGLFMLAEFFLKPEDAEAVERIEESDARYEETNDF
ncbi:MAG: GNAT family N-acetyltransferase [Alphaproteobacteria bacterium]|nr:GNAT family N-acetyltransferase [Alphaproteobacteria bacterium]